MPPQPAPTRGDTDWLTHDRFGLFIHWGLYALPARHEWVKNRERLDDAHYDRYFRHFDPDLYDPRQWARDAKAAGMKYVVLTTKHHEGFCLWDSDLTDYKATNTPAGRDLVRPFVAACRAEGLKVGFYYSLIDWHHPDFTVDSLHPQRDDADARAANTGRDMATYRAYLHGQVQELLTRYGQIDVLWLDFSYRVRHPDGKGRDDWGADALYATLRDLAPKIVLNDRLDLPGAADVHTPEQYQPRGWVTADGTPVTWEACQTLNGSWGYDRDNLDWKSPTQLVRLLIDTVAKGGNLLLNVGPTARDEFDPRARATLAAIGEWMRLHDRSITGATAADFAPPPDCRYTQRGDRLYLHLFAWPFRHVHLDGLADRFDYAQLLHDGSEIRRVESERHGDRPMSDVVSDAAHDTVTLQLPIQKPDVTVPVIEIFLK